MTMVGAMDKRVEIQTPTNADADKDGEYSATWAKLYDAWASITEPQAYEQITAERMGHRVTHKIVIWYRSGITSAMRIKFGSLYLYIKSIVNPGERNEFLEMTAEEKN